MNREIAAVRDWRRIDAVIESASNIGARWEERLETGEEITPKFKIGRQREERKVQIWRLVKKSLALLSCWLVVERFSEDDNIISQYFFTRITL